MPWVKSPILGGFSKSRATSLSDAEMYNLFLEIIETKDGGSPGSLLNTPGLDLIGTLGSGPVRAVRDLNDILYVVSGGSVYSLTPNGIATLLGQIGNNSTPVSMFNNTTQLMMVDGVGGWLVPGGYPLTGGTIDTPGSLYAVNDTITLQPTSGAQTSYPIVTVTAISNDPVNGLSLPNTGTGYSTGTGIATTPIQGQGGGGSGLTLNTTAVNGGVTSASVNVGGTSYAVNDTGTISAGDGGAIYQVTGVSGGVVTSVIILRPGVRYATASGVATMAQQAVPPNIGTGLTINITSVSGGAITGYTIANGGENYVIENVGYISGGGGNATYLVTGVAGNGVITSIKVTAGGAMNPIPAGFTQKSTSGSGSGFTLTSPGFGSFLGIVPVTLPFSKPVKGAVSDGFGLLVFQGSQNLASSDQADLSTWQALDYGVADQSPDNCISIEVIHDEAYILKQRNTEVWVDQGLSGFPFGPLQGVHMEYGCAAPFSVAKAGELLIWLSRNDQGQGIIVEAAAYQIRPISTQALVAEFDGYSNIGDAIGYCFQQGGHVFYVITFPEANKTWCYDVTTSALLGFPQWQRMAIWNVDTWNRHYGNCYWPWRGTVASQTSTTTYEPNGVTISTGSELDNSDLTGIPSTYYTALLSEWLYIPDSSGVGLTFTNQADATLSTVNPGIYIAVQNDSAGSPQITVKAYDSSSAIIVSATYDFTNWSGWVNIMVSINTASQELQVFANTGTGAGFTETQLTAVSSTWSSSNAIGNVTSKEWRVLPT